MCAANCRRVVCAVIRRSSHGVCGSIDDRRPSSPQTTIVVPTKVAWCVPTISCWSKTYEFTILDNLVLLLAYLCDLPLFSLLRRPQYSENPLFVNYFYTDIHFRSPMFKFWTIQLYVCSLATFFFYCFKTILLIILIVYHIYLIDLLVYKSMSVTLLCTIVFLHMDLFV